MMKKKIGLILLGVMCAVSMGVKPVKATIEENTVIENQENKVVKHGVYEAKNITRYIDPNNATGESMARKSIVDTTKIEVKEGKTFFTIEFTKDMYMFMSNLSASIDGQALSVIGDNNARTITFEVPSMDTEVLIGMDVVMMGRSVQCYVKNDMSTLKTISEEFEDVKKPEVGDTKVLEDGNYTIQNDVTYAENNSHALEMARKLLNAESNLEVKDGKNYLTLNFNQELYKAVGSLAVKVDSKEVKVEKNDEKCTVTFEVPNLKSDIQVTTAITMMGNREVTFGVVLKEDSVKVVSKEDNKPVDNNGGNVQDNTNGENVDTVEPEEDKTSTPKVEEVTSSNNEVVSTGESLSLASSILGLMTTGASAAFFARKRK